MRMQKNERGITLVALVVTIVVLLILAGVTIMYVMSDNGIFGQAQEAGNKTDTAVVEEAVFTAIMGLYPEVYTSEAATDADLGTALTASFKTNMPSSMAVADGVAITASKGSVSSIEVAGLEVTYKGITYTVVYNKQAPENGKSGVVATKK